MKFKYILSTITIIILWFNSTLIQAQCTDCTVTNPVLSGNYTFAANSVVCFTSNATLGDVTFQNNSKICVAAGVTVIIQNNINSTNGHDITFEVRGILQFNQSPQINANVSANIFTDGIMRAGSTGNNNLTFNGSGYNIVTNHGTVQVGVLGFQNNSAENIIDNYNLFTIGGNINVQGTTIFRNLGTINISSSYNNNPSSTYINCGTINSNTGYNLGGGLIINSGEFNVPSGQIDLPNGSRLNNYGVFTSGGTINNNGASSVVYNEGLMYINNYQGSGRFRGPDVSSKKGYFETNNQMTINSSRVGPNLDFKRTTGPSNQSTVFNSTPTYVDAAGNTTTQALSNVSFDCVASNNCSAPLVTTSNCASLENVFPLPCDANSVGNRVSDGTFPTTGGNTNTVTGWTVDGTTSTNWPVSTGKVFLGTDGVEFRRDQSTITTLDQSISNVDDYTIIHIEDLYWVRTATNNATTVGVLDILYNGVVYATINTTSGNTPTITDLNGAQISRITLATLSSPGKSGNVDLSILLPANVPASGLLRFRFTAGSAATDVRDIGMKSVSVINCTKTDLSLTMTVDDATPEAGGTVTFTITAFNNGPDNELNAEVQNLLPSGYTYVNHSISTNGGSYDPNNGLWTIGTINNNSSFTLTIEATVNLTGNYTNVATISGDNLDNNLNNNEASETTSPRFVVAQNDINKTQLGVTIDGQLLTNDNNATQVTVASQGNTAISLSVPTVITGGTITINTDGTYLFTPAPSFEGQVPLINITVANTNGLSFDEATLSIDVISPYSTDSNNMPVAIPDTATVEQGETATIFPLANDSDLDGDTLSITTITGLDDNGNPLILTSSLQNVYNANGDLVGQANIDINGNLVFITDANYIGHAPFSYEISDGNGGFGMSEINVTVVLNTTDFVYANDDANAAPQDVTMVGDILVNDQLNGTNPRITSITARYDGTDYPITPGTPETIPNVGEMTLNADGSYTFVPLSTFANTFLVVYTVCNDEGNYDIATLYLTNVKSCGFLPNTDTPEAFTLIGISTLAEPLSGWPYHVPNGFITLESKEKGFVITRTVSGNIASPVEGMLIYDTDDNCFKLYNGSGWNCISRACID